MTKRRTARPGARQPETATESPLARLWQRPWLPPLIFLTLSLVYFWEFVATDHIVFGYDIGRDFHRGARMGIEEKLATLSQPLWDPKMGGFPSSEEIRPQYSPTYLIYFFTTFQRHIGWRYILMMFLAGWGMFTFVRELSLRRMTALWAGIAYMFAPAFLAFTYAGHYAKMGVITLFPWMVFLLFRGMRSQRPVHFALLGLLIGFGIYSPHPQMLYHALLGLGLIFLFLAIEHYVSERDRRRAGVQTALFAFAVVLGLGVGAEGVFPLYHFTRTESKRADSGTAQQPAEEQLARARSWSLHPEEAASLVIPEFGGFSHPGDGTSYYWGRNPGKDNSEYFGVLAVMLALVGIALPGRSRLALFLGALFVVVLAYTLGGHTPVHLLAFHLLPGARVMRALGMAAFVFAFAAVALGALGLNRLLDVSEAAEPQATARRRLLQVSGALTAIGLLVAAAPQTVTDLWIAVLYSSITPEKREVLARGYDWLARGGLLVALVCAAGTALLYLRLRRQVAAGWAVAGLCVLSVLDTWRIDRVFLQYEDPDQYADIRTENRETVKFLKQQDEPLRIFPVPDYRLLRSPGYHLHGIPTVTGFHDFTMARYDRMLEEFEPVVGMLRARYYHGREVPYSDAELLQSIDPLLDLLNAHYVVAPRGAQLAADDFPLVFSGHRFQVYENIGAMPFFYLAREFRLAASGQEALAWLRAGEVELAREVVLERAPDPEWKSAVELPAAAAGIDSANLQVFDLAEGSVQVHVRCSGPRILVVSQNYHEGWSASVDGEPAELMRANYVWQGVPVAEGEHTVELRYHSPVMAGSRLVSGLALMIVVATVAGSLWRRRGRVSGR